jgi:hypothetical protein
VGKVTLEGNADEAISDDLFFQEVTPMKQNQ